MKRRIFKEDIVKNGHDLFYEKGFASTGINEITQKTKIPKGSFYNHFKSKEEFGISVLDYYHNMNKTFLKQALLNEDKSPLINLKKYFIDFMEEQNHTLNCSKGCLMSNLTMEMADRSMAFQEKVKENFEEITSVFESCLNNAKQQNEIDENLNTALMANFIYNSWQGSIIRMKADKSTDALWKFYNIVFDKLLK
jgi:TetR/AcrR family transcriptional repressor of nem operon